MSCQQTITSTSITLYTLKLEELTPDGWNFKTTIVNHKKKFPHLTVFTDIVNCRIITSQLSCQQTITSSSITLYTLSFPLFILHILPDFRLAVIPFFWISHSFSFQCRRRGTCVKWRGRLRSHWSLPWDIKKNPFSLICHHRLLSNGSLLMLPALLPSLLILGWHQPPINAFHSNPWTFILKTHQC